MWILGYLKKYKIFFVTILGLFLAQFFYFNVKMIQLRKSFHHKMSKHKTIVRKNEFICQKTLNKHVALPRQLQGLPNASQTFVKGVKTISIRNCFAPYNPAILEKEDGGYFLFFRYDRLVNMFSPEMYTYIGNVELDENFQQTDREYITVETNSHHSEDPRLFFLQNQLYLIYNDLFSEKRRGIHIAKLDEKNAKTEVIYPLDLEISETEKNWAPFVYQSPEGNAQLFFEYEIAKPRNILRLDIKKKPTSFQIDQEVTASPSALWEDIWGKPLGGTPARLVDGNYLGFFHSKFKDRAGIFWYVIGAYAFEPQPPFRITAISSHPILFEGIYDTEYQNTADPSKCVIFPGGFAIVKKDGKELLHLACGENDSAIKILTIDKNELLDSLLEINVEQ